MTLKSMIQSNYLELVIAGIFLPLLLFPKFVALYMAIIILSVGLSYYKRQIQFTIYKTPLLFALLYVFYLIGMIWTQDKELAEFYAVNKLSFLIIPFLFAFKKEGGFNISIIYWGLIIACLISFTKGVYFGIPSYLKYHSIQYSFMRSYLSPTIHPTYMTLFTQFALVAVIHFWHKRIINAFWAGLLIVILSLFIFLLLSLSGVLFFACFVFGAFIYFLGRRFSKKIVIVIASFMMLSGMFSVFYIPFLKDDLSTALNAMNRYISSPTAYIKDLPNEPTGSDVRLVMWTVSYQEISEHPLGIGTGNVDIYLGRSLRSHGLDHMAELEYNPHNQFFQTTLETGIPGGFLLMMIIITGIILAFRIRSIILLLLFANLFLNSLFESMLQNQAGIIFYPLLFMLLLIEHHSFKLKRY